jgi:glycerol-3-phosphate acyltransferase PlsY
MNVIDNVVALLGAYLLGSIPTAYMIGRARKKTDIREVGSRNMGAMNTFYEVGFIWGLLVLAVDIGKGMAAMAIASALNVSDVVYLAAGLVAVLGHAFPVFLGFRGGKGGATAIGVLAFLMRPWSYPVYIGAFLMLFAFTRAATISYSLAFICFPFISWYAFHRWDWAVYSFVIVIIPLVRYIPRIKEMRDRAGSWRRVFQRKNVSERY